MPSLHRHLLLPAASALLLAVSLAAQPSPANPTPSSAPNPEIRAAAPVRNFRLPSFTDEGFRASLLRAAEARILSPERIEVSDVHLVLYSGDIYDRIETTLTSPLAIALVNETTLSGPDTVHLQRAEIEVRGADWSYDHALQKITINRDAHVLLRAQIGDLIR